MHALNIVTTGLDLQSLAGEVMSGGAEDADVGRKAFHLRTVVSKFQDSITALEKVLYCIFLKCLAPQLYNINAFINDFLVSELHQHFE